jgi:metallo-beta-lactamase class B
LIIGGMKKVGLDPAQIKYVLISHAHADHIGGAEMLQKRYGARIVMGGPDWEWVENIRTATKPWHPSVTSSQLTA